MEIGQEAAKYISKSKSEIEIDDFVQSICKCKVELNCRSILKDGKELDIYIPEKRLAIEFNGDYWHMNPRKYSETDYNSQLELFAKQKWEYDKAKYDECEHNGIQLIVIWEYDWIHSREEIKNQLLEVLD